MGGRDGRMGLCCQEEGKAERDGGWRRSRREKRAGTGDEGGGEGPGDLSAPRGRCQVELSARGSGDTESVWDRL